MYTVGAGASFVSTSFLVDGLSCSLSNCTARHSQLSFSWPDLAGGMISLKPYDGVGYTWVHSTWEYNVAVVTDQEIIHIVFVMLLGYCCCRRGNNAFFVGSMNVQRDGKVMDQATYCIFL